MRRPMPVATTSKRGKSKRRSRRRLTAAVTMLMAMVLKRPKQWMKATAVLRGTRPRRREKATKA